MNKATCHTCQTVLFSGTAAANSTIKCFKCGRKHAYVEASDCWVPVGPCPSRDEGPGDQLRKLLDRADLDPGDRFEARRLVAELESGT